MIDSDKLNDCLAAVVNERENQEQAKAQGKFLHTCDDPDMTDPERLAVLMEEVGEVSTEVLKTCDEKQAGQYDQQVIRQQMKEELAQVAAVAVAWMESI